MNLIPNRKFGYFIISSFFVLVPVFVLAADLVNINTADSVTLQSLNGIGPSKAQAIIDYRTQNGPFQTIESIQNVSGIGPATYANIKDFITVGVATQPAQTSQTQTSTTSTDTSTTQTTPASQSGSGNVPALLAKITANATSVVGAGAAFSGQALTQSGAGVDNARYMWNFGDGATMEGQSVFHSYAYPGTYVAVLTVASGYSTGQAQVSVKAVPANLALVAENDGSLMVVNNSSLVLDIGQWLLICGTNTFLIPPQTNVLARAGVRFSPGVTGLSCGTNAALEYPQGTVAAHAALSADSPLHGTPVASSELKVAQKVSTPAPLPVSVPASAALPFAPMPTSSEATTSPAPSADTPTEAAAAILIASIPQPWFYVLGGAAFFMLCAGSVLYMRPLAPGRTETAPTASEFEIE